MSAFAIDRDRLSVILDGYNIRVRTSSAAGETWEICSDDVLIEVAGLDTLRALVSGLVAVLVDGDLEAASDVQEWALAGVMDNDPMPPDLPDRVLATVKDGA